VSANRAPSSASEKPRRSTPSPHVAPIAVGVPAIRADGVAPGIVTLAMRGAVAGATVGGAVVAATVATVAVATPTEGVGFAVGVAAPPQAVRISSRRQRSVLLGYAAALLPLIECSSP